MRSFAALALVFAATSASIAADPPADWKAGVATVDITPEKPMWMAGYAARTKPAEGTAQNLFAKALALEDTGGTRVVVVTLDLISVPRFLRERLETAAREKYKLPPEGLLLNCSHTHCGPELRVADTPRPGETPERAKQATAYARKLEEQLTDLIGAALKDLAPAKLSYARARCGFAMNRRLAVPDGWANSPNPDGPVDHDVPVLRVDGANGKPRAILFGYACHNTTLGFYQWCGDYAGFAQDFVQRSNSGAVALFMAGCGGDQNPYPRGTLDQAKQHGEALGNAVVAALQTRPRPVHGPLRVAIDQATVDYATPLPSKDDLLKRKETSKDKYDQNHAERLLKHLEDNGKLPANYSAPVQVLRFGDDLLLIALPGETVVDFSLRLKKELAGVGPAVWVAGYSNDVFAYLPSKRVLKEGGYEGGGAMKYMSYPHPGPFSDTVEERIVEKARQLADRLAKPAAK
ncbi:MAG: neutral/alkaline non-lysosomal ceramidase N-terminal domain-containing protein [Planctomycetes bacterium]|nr:neutral/alkaline non-lysosomal ceramidase N-terminal domain-containing protein [Planctomycetota bacterium]